MRPQRQRACCGDTLSTRAVAFSHSLWWSLGGWQRVALFPGSTNSAHTTVHSALYLHSSSLTKLSVTRAERTPQHTCTVECSTLGEVVAKFGQQQWQQQKWQQQRWRRPSERVAPRFGKTKGANHGYVDGSNRRVIAALWITAAQLLLALWICLPPSSTFCHFSRCHFPPPESLTCSFYLFSIRRISSQLPAAPATLLTEVDTTTQSSTITEWSTSSSSKGRQRSMPVLAHRGHRHLSSLSRSLLLFVSGVIQFTTAHTALISIRL